MKVNVGLASNDVTFINSTSLIPIDSIGTLFPCMAIGVTVSGRIPSRAPIATPVLQVPAPFGLIATISGMIASV